MPGQRATVANRLELYLDHTDGWPPSSDSSGTYKTVRIDGVEKVCSLGSFVRKLNHEPVFGLNDNYRLHAGDLVGLASKFGAAYLMLHVCLAGKYKQNLFSCV